MKTTSRILMMGLVCLWATSAARAVGYSVDFTTVSSPVADGTQFGSEAGKFGLEYDGTNSATIDGTNGIYLNGSGSNTYAALRSIQTWDQPITDGFFYRIRANNVSVGPLTGGGIGLMDGGNFPFGGSA